MEGMRRASLASLVALTACSDYDVTRNGFSDGFVQDDGNLRVDVLWVMDDSGTMSEEQSNVIANLSQFVSVMARMGADWQVGAVTTSAGSGGGLLTGDIVTAYDAEVESRFAELVDVGTAGEREEQGLLALELATSEPLLSGENAGLLRDGADLAVIVLSDEDDQSPGDVADYVAHLEALKGAGNARLSAVVGQLPAGCASPYAAADPAARYIEVATATGGLQDSICRVDFSETMKDLALNALGLDDTFELTRVPEPETLEVLLDGVKLHERPENGWQYDAGLNAIVLDGYAVPGPGAAITVNYFEWLGNVESDDTAEPAE